jgi:hypothetical protein
VCESVPTKKKFHHRERREHREKDLKIKT